MICRSINLGRCPSSHQSRNLTCTFSCHLLTLLLSSHMQHPIQSIPMTLEKCKMLAEKASNVSDLLRGGRVRRRLLGSWPIRGVLLSRVRVGLRWIWIDGLIPRSGNIRVVGVDEWVPKSYHCNDCWRRENEGSVWHVNYSRLSWNGTWGMSIYLGEDSNP